MDALRRHRRRGSVLTGGDWVVAAHLTAAAAYAGFQWTVRILVYPQFAAVGDRAPAAFPAYERSHQRRISVVVGPLFGGLVLSTAALALTRPGSVFGWLSVAATTTVLAVTAFGAVPQHRRLAHGWDRAAYQRLLRYDTVRVIAATTQLACAVLILR